MRRLTRFQRNAYASGAFTKSTLWNFTDLLLLYYLADIQGLGASTAGLILMVSLIVSGILDITLSVMLDTYRLRYQKVIALSAPITVLSFALLFYPVELAKESLFLFYLVAAIVFRIGYALLDIPHNAMLGTLTSDSRERTKLSSARIFFNASAILVFAAFAGKVIALLETPGDSLRLWMLGLCCLFMLSNIYLCIMPVWSLQIQPLQVQRPPLRATFTALFKNRAFMVLALYALLPCIFIPVFYKSGVYFASMLLADEKLTNWLIISLAIGKLVALPGFVKLSYLIEKHHAMILGLVGLIAVLLIFMVFTPRSLPFLCLAFFSCGIFAGGLMVLIWSALPDTIEYGLRETGVVNPTLTFGAFHLVMRVSDGLSFAVIAGVLEWSALQTAGNAEFFVDSIAIIAAIGCVLGVAVLWFYPITHQCHQEMVNTAEEKTAINQR